MGRAEKNSIRCHGETLAGLEVETTQEVGRRQALAAGLLQLGQAQRPGPAGHNDAVHAQSQHRSGLARRLGRFGPPDLDRLAVDLRRRAGALQVLASPRPCLELDAVEGLRFDDASRDAVVVALHARCALSPKFHLHVGRDFRFAVEPPTTLTSEGSVSLVHSGASPADDLVVVDLGDDAPAILSLRAR